MWRRALLTAIALTTLVPGAAQAAAGARVTVQVVGRSGTVSGPRDVVAAQRSVRVGRRTCRAPRSTPLAALAAMRVAFAIRDGGSCSGLYVESVAGQAARGVSGWVYKVGRRAGTTAVGDPSGPFGTGRRLRSGDHLSWFWCTLRAGSCQRTLGVRRVSTGGGRLTLVVTGYDDFGRAKRVPNATVRLTGPTGRNARTSARGVVRLRGLARGRYRAVASAPGTVVSFPTTVTVS